MRQPRDKWMIGMDPAKDRLMQQVQRQNWRRPDVPAPTPHQVAMVLHALADHTALEQARVWDRTENDGSGNETTFCPTSTSIGRWLHAFGDLLDEDKS